MSFRAIFPWKTNYKTMFTDIVRWYFETPQDFPVNTSQLQVAGGFFIVTLVKLKDSNPSRE